MSQTPSQLPLRFPGETDDSQNGTVPPTSNGQEENEFYKSVRKSSIALTAEEGLPYVDDSKPKLALPRRWEFCFAKAKEIDAVNSLLQIVRTPAKALDEFGHYLSLLNSSAGEGALWIFHGNAGSGKSTFLQTLEHKINTAEEDIVEVQVIRGELVNLSDRLKTYEVFQERVRQRRSVDTTLILVLEDVEVGLNDQELETLAQALKMVLRSSHPNLSNRVLVTIPVNNQRFGTRLHDVSREIGLLMRESGTSSLYVFEGPKEEEYIDIVEDLTRVLNGRPLADFGIRRDMLEQIPRRRVNIGDFIQNVVAKTNEQDEKITKLIRDRQYKKIVTIFAFVRPMHPVDLYSAVQLMVADPESNVSPRWLLSESSHARNIWDEQTTKFAAIVHGVLRVKVVEFPRHILGLMIQMSGDKKLQQNLLEHIRDQDLNTKMPRNWSNVRESIASTNLVRLLTGEETKRPSHVGGVEPLPEDSHQTKQKRELLRRGIEIARWATTQNQYELHGTIALALNNLIKTGSPSVHIPGLKGIWSETPIGINGVKPDITVETLDTLYLIEFNYESGVKLTRADMARYMMQKINVYCDQIPLLKQIVQSL